MVVEMLHGARAVAGALLEGKRNEAGVCYVCFSCPTRSSSGSSRGGSPINLNPGNNLHVSGLSHRVDSRDLETHFAVIGRVSHTLPVTRPVTNTTKQVQKAQVMRDPHTHESRGFGFVTMESPAEADAAIAALNGQDFFGKTLAIEKVCSLLLPFGVRR